MSATGFFAALAAAVQFFTTHPTIENAPAIVQWSCAEPAWVKAPELRDGKVNAELAGQCLIRNASDRGIRNLSQYLRGYATRNVTLHSGPHEEMFEGLPSLRFDVTERMGRTDPLIVRQDIHVASDDSSKLIYAIFSKSVEASGFAGYLKKLDTVLTVWPGQEPGSYSLAFFTRIVVDRPWYAPGGYFRSKVQEIARDKYLEARASILPTIARNL